MLHRQLLLRHQLLQLAVARVEVVRLLPVAAAKRFVQLAAHPLELAFTWHTRIPEQLGLAARQALARHALLERASDQLWHLDQPAIVRVRPRPRSDPAGVL